MLARYTMKRGKPSGGLPHGVRQDTRRHTRHCLRPTAEMVDLYLRDPTDRAWAQFETEYRSVVERRFSDDRSPFDEVAELAMLQDVYLGCSCPTKKNPNVWHCHTVLALRFMQEHYSRLKLVFPERSGDSVD